MRLASLFAGRPFAAGLLAVGCLLAVVADASACGRRGRASSGSCGPVASAGSSCNSGCGSGFTASYTQGQYAPCPPCSSGFQQGQPIYHPAAPQFVPQPMPAAPTLPGVGPALVPDANPTKAPPGAAGLPASQAAPTDLIPAFAADATGKLRQVGWLRGTQFLPLQP